MSFCWFSAQICFVLTSSLNHAKVLYCAYIMSKPVLSHMQTTTGADQPTHPCTLISTFVHCLDSIIPTPATLKNFIKTPASFCSWAGQFESYLAGFFLDGTCMIFCLSFDIALFPDIIHSGESLSVKKDTRMPVQGKELLRKVTSVFWGLWFFKSACAATQQSQRFGSLSEASSSSLYCVSEQRRLWRECAGLSEPLLVAYVISTLFTWAVSYHISL